MLGREQYEVMSGDPWPDLEQKVASREVKGSWYVLCHYSTTVLPNLPVILSECALACVLIGLLPATTGVHGVRS